MNHLSHRFTNTGKQEENAGLRPWSNQKCEASSRKVTSLHERPQPSLSQLPLLLQERGKVAHGGQRVRMIRTELCFEPCKSSAVQGLRLASWRWEQYGGPGDVKNALTASDISD